MKTFFTFLLLITVVTLVAIPACNKDDNEIIQSSQNPPPVASAGNDTTIKMALCKPTATALLDGHFSFDPGNNSRLKFLWKQVSGPTRAFDGVDSARSVVVIDNLVVGEYKFELEVFDTQDLSDIDSMKISIIDYASYPDLELELNGPFSFNDNFEYYGYHYDEFGTYGTLIIGNESFNYNFYEEADTAVINTRFSNYFNLYDVASGSKFIGGDCSVDFDALYVKGGGAFDGTIKLTGGSALIGCEAKMKDYPPLQVTGKMDAGSNTIKMKIKGSLVL